MLDQKLYHQRAVITAPTNLDYIQFSNNLISSSDFSKPHPMERSRLHLEEHLGESFRARLVIIGGDGAATLGYIPAARICPTGSAPTIGRAGRSMDFLGGENSKAESRTALVRKGAGAEQRGIGASTVPVRSISDVHYPRTDASCTSA